MTVITTLAAPCPFCAGDKIELAENFFTEEDALEEGWSQTTFYAFVCPCGAMHGDYPGHASPELALAKWNTRHRRSLDG